MTPEESELLAQALEAMKRVEPPAPRRQSRQVLRKCLTCGGPCSERCLYCAPCGKARAKVLHAQRKRKRSLKPAPKGAIKILRQITPAGLDDVKEWT